MTLGQRIQELRKEQGLSQEVLGERLGVSRQAVSRWEMDGAVPEVDKLIALSRVFGVSLNDLLQVEEGAQGQQAGVTLSLPRHWRIGVLVLAVVCLLCLGSTIYLGWRVAELEGQLTAQTHVLDPDRPMVGGFEFETTVLEEEGRIECFARLAAVQKVEGMEVELQVLDEAGGVTVLPLDNAGGTVYTGTLELAWPEQRGVTLSAVFRDGSGSYSQPLEERIIGKTGGQGTVLWY